MATLTTAPAALVSERRTRRVPAAYGARAPTRRPARRRTARRCPRTRATSRSSRCSRACGRRGSPPASCHGPACRSRACTTCAHSRRAWAEYAYIYRLAAAGPFGGTAVTSMPQLVRGLARHCHPSWQLTEDKFVDRDRYHCAVRRRLRDLDAMGLLRWRTGIDDDGEERRTELVLRPVPELLPAELEAAARAAWPRGRPSTAPMLNTGSTTGVRDAPAIAAPLQPAERASRAIVRVKRRSAARRVRASNEQLRTPLRGSGYAGELLGAEYQPRCTIWRCSWNRRAHAATKRHRFLCDASQPHRKRQRQCRAQRRCQNCITEDTGVWGPVGVRDVADRAPGARCGAPSGAPAGVGPDRPPGAAAGG